MQYASVNKKYYCGIDMHAKKIYVCVMTKTGKIVIHREIPSDFSLLLQLIEKYQGNIAICCESTFNWYWLADGCHEHNIPFYLGHAFYMKLIHGGKKKDDRIDSRTLADLLRMNLFPLAYDYPKKMRTTRDLLRRRHKLVRLRAKLYRHIKMYLYQQGIKGLPESAIQIKRKKHEVLTLLKDTPDALMMVDTDIALIEFLDTLLPKLEWQVHVKAKQHDRKSFALLQTIDGLGEMLGLTILYEMHTVNRFETAQRFSSYYRVVKVSRFSAGRKLGSKNSKIGNPYLRWAFGQVAVLSTKYYPEIKRYYERRKKKYGTKKALAILAHKFAVAVYYMLKKGKPFDVAQFIVAC